MATTTLIFAGDPHGCFEPLQATAAQYDAVAYVLLGDMQLERPLEQALADLTSRLWWIPGNHDSDRELWYDCLFDSALANRNLYGTVVDVGGVRVAGLGGVFRANVWHPDTGVNYRSRVDFLQRTDKAYHWRGGLPLQHRTAIWWEDYERLFDQRADILVTHEAPSCHRYGFKAIDELAQAMQVKQIVHGHHHEDYHDRIGDIQVIGVGFARTYVLEWKT